MKIRQIRNATLRIDYGGKTFLVDPWLREKGGMGALVDTPFRSGHPERETIPMPMCELPVPRAEILRGVDACIVTHVHPDHIDMEADGRVGCFLDRTVPVCVQSADDAAVFEHSGFERVSVLPDAAEAEPLFGGVRLARTPGRHGTIAPCGPSSGLLFRNPEEKILYVAGDTIWYDGVARILERWQPDVIVLNACAAELVGYGRLLMDDGDVAMVRRACPQATVLISHMDTVAHASITREGMRERLRARRLGKGILIPDDGEVCAF